MDVAAAWELVRNATPPGGTVGRPIYLGNRRWAVWAVGPAPGQDRQYPPQLEGTGSTQAEALTSLAAKLRRNGR